MKKGKFDVPGCLAREWLALPTNPNGLANEAVLAPWLNGLDITRRPTDTWIVDFGLDAPMNAAAMFEEPFRHVERVVKPKRDTVRNDLERTRWWLHARPAPDLREAIRSLDRCIGTARVAKHRLFAWLPSHSVIDGQIVVIARDDEVAFGVLHSRFHEVWSLRMGTSLEDRPRYTPTTCFETFPFPEGLSPNVTAGSYASDTRAIAIGEAAKDLVDARDRWLNPPEWVDREPEVVAGYPDRIIAKPGHEADLKKRTLTNLYNARPAWLDNLHRELDVAVAAAYGWEWPMADEEIIQRLFALNQERAASQ